MAQVFISYSRRDKVLAERLARDLDDAGLSIWIDFRQIKGGEQWREAIFKGIAQSDIFLVCLSPGSVESEWVRREIFMARTHHKFVIPLMMQDCFDALTQYEETAWLRDIQIIDFARSYEQAIPLLLHALPGLESKGEEEVPADIPCPFKGLEAFQQTDAHIFFGREDLIGKLLDRLRDHHKARFLAVVGASGSGKSSLVRAGLIPALRAGKLPYSDQWPIVIFKPGAQPAEALAARLLPLIGDSLLLPRVISLLDQEEANLHQIAEGILTEAPTTARLVLVIDQFEEVFTRASHLARERFLNLICTAATVPDGRTLVVLTMRADFFDRLSSYPDLAELFEQENMVIATEMTAENIRRSIEEPAKTVGLTYDVGLPERLLEEVRQQPGSLPLLQYALKELYEHREGRRLTNDAFDEIGGVRRALARHAESIYVGLDTTQREIMRRMLLQLVEVSDIGEATRRQTAREDLTFEGIPDQAMQEVIDRLTAAESRLLITSREISTREEEDAEPKIWLEVSHEALIREWDRFADWIADNKEALRYGSELLKAAQDWYNSGQDVAYLLTGSRLKRAEAWLETADANKLQKAFIKRSLVARQRQLEAQQARQAQELHLKQRAANRLRYLAVALTLFLIVALLLSFYALGERNNARNAADQAANEAEKVKTQAAIAEKNAIIAENNAITATVAQGEAQVQADKAETQVVVAEEALARAETAQASALRQASRSLAASAKLELIGPQPERAMLLAIEALKLYYTPQAEEAIVDAMLENRMRHVFFSEQAQPSPDGQYVALIKRGELSVWRIRDMVQLLLAPIGSGADYQMAWSHDSAAILIVDNFGEHALTIWDVTTGKTTLSIYKGVLSAEWSPSSQQVLVMRENEGNATASIYDVTSREQVYALPNDLSKIAWSPDGTRILTLQDFQVIVYEAFSGLELFTIGSNILDAQWSRTGARIITSDGYQIIFWMGTTGESTGIVLEGEEVVAAPYNVVAPELFPSPTPYLEPSPPPGEGMSDNGDSLQPLLFAQWSPDDTLILINHKMREVATGQVRYELDYADLQQVLWSSDGTRIITTDANNNLHIYDAVTGEQQTVLAGHGSQITKMVSSKDGMLLLTSSEDRVTRLWDLNEGQERLTIYGHASIVDHLVWSPDEADIITSDRGGTVRVWNMDSTASVHALPDISAPAQWSPDGRRVLYVHKDGVMKIIDAYSNLEVFTLQPHEGVPLLATWAPDGQRIAAVVKVGNSLTLTIWDAQTGQSEDTAIMVWEVASSDFVKGTWGKLVTPLDWSPDGKHILALWGLNEFQLAVALWDVETGDPLYTRPISDEALSIGLGTSLKWSPDGTRYVVSSLPYVIGVGVQEGVTTIRDAASGEILLTLPGFTLGNPWSPDGTRLVTILSSTNSTVVWDAHTGEDLLTVPGYALNDAWSPDGTHLAVAQGNTFDAFDTEEPFNLTDNTTTAFVVDVETGSQVEIAGLDVELSRLPLTWSPDSKRLLLSGELGSLWVWDVEQQTSIFAFTGHRALIEYAKWSSDGKHIVSSGADATAYIWPAWQTPTELIAYAQSCCIYRDFTTAEREHFGLEAEPTASEPPISEPTQHAQSTAVAQAMYATQTSVFKIEGTATASILYTDTPTPTATPTPFKTVIPETISGPRIANLVEVVVAVQNMPRGMIIPEDGIGIMPWPREALPEEGNYFNAYQIGDVVGRIAMTDIFRGALIHPSQVVDDLGYSFRAKDNGDFGSGRPVQGEIWIVEDIRTSQVWEFSGVEGQTVTITMDAHDSWRSPLDPYLLLCTDNGYVLAMDDDSGTGINALIQNFILPYTGNYVVWVTSFTGPGAYSLALLTSENFSSLEKPDLQLAAYYPNAPAQATSTQIPPSLTSVPAFTPIFSTPIATSSLTPIPTVQATYPVIYEVEIVVAAQDIPRGTVISEFEIGFMSWPRMALPEEGNYFTFDEMSEVVGKIARTDIFRGSPIFQRQIVDNIEEVARVGGIKRIHMGEWVTGESFALGWETIVDSRWVFEGVQGQTLTISMDVFGVNAINPYLVLLGPDGTVVAKDDDSGEGTNARIEHLTLPQSGVYTIRATGYMGETKSDGRFQLDRAYAEYNLRIQEEGN